MADRNAERRNSSANSRCSSTGKSGVLGGLHVFNVCRHGLIFSVEQFLDCLGFAVGSAKERGQHDEKGIDHIVRSSLGTILAYYLAQRGRVMRTDPQGQPPKPNLSDKALDEQQEWLRVTLSSIGDAVITTDASGNVTFLNPVAESLTGWSLDEASGVPLDAVFKIVNEETRQYR